MNFEWETMSLLAVAYRLFAHNWFYKTIGITTNQLTLIIQLIHNLQGKILKKIMLNQKLYIGHKMSCFIWTLASICWAQAACVYEIVSLSMGQLPQPR